MIMFRLWTYHGCLLAGSVGLVTQILFLVKLTETLLNPFGALE
jgi:hypothetical protein